MKRARSFSSTLCTYLSPSYWFGIKNNDEAEPLVDDIWSLIINLYYWLKFNEQWLRIKQGAHFSSIYFLPIEKIELSIYRVEELSETVYVVSQIKRLYWNIAGIIGVGVLTYQFIPSHPLRVRKSAQELVIVPLCNPHLFDRDFDNFKGCIIKGISSKSIERSSRPKCRLILPTALLHPDLAS